MFKDITLCSWGIWWFSTSWISPNYFESGSQAAYVAVVVRKIFEPKKEKKPTGEGDGEEEEEEEPTEEGTFMVFI